MPLACRHLAIRPLRVLRRRLSSAGIDVVGEVADADELARIAQARPHVLVARRNRAE